MFLVLLAMILGGFFYAVNLKLQYLLNRINEDIECIGALRHEVEECKSKMEQG